MSVALVTIGVICILYGVFVMMIRSGTWFFAFWYALGALFIGAGLAVRMGLWGTLPSLARWAVGAVTAVVLFGFAVCNVLIFQDFNDRGEPGLDYIVVLGAQVHESGPSTVLKHRLDTANAYLQKNEGTTCIVSGGKGDNEHAPEAHVMAEYLIERGIPAERIIVEDASLNTAQNIEFSAQHFDRANDAVGIVTNNFHEHRALAIARKAGVAHAMGIAAPSDPAFLPNNLARESLSLMKDFLVGNL